MSINAIEPPAPPQAARIDAPARPEAPQTTGAINGPRRFIVQFASVPDDADDIVCTTETMVDWFSPEIARQLVFSPATAWLARLYPRELAQAMDAQAAALEDVPDDIRAPGFERYYRLRFSGGADAATIIDVLARCANVTHVQMEHAHVELQAPPPSAVPAPGNNPNFANQIYLTAAPRGISAAAAWSAGASGAGIRVALAEKGFKPTHRDLSFAKPLAEGTGGVEHLINVAGIIAALDNKDDIVGVAPGVDPLVLTAIDAPSKKPRPGNTVLEANAIEALALLNAPGSLRAGDVVNLSIGAFFELNRQHKQAAAIVSALKKPGSAATLLNLFATVPMESDVAVLALIKQLSARGITVCMAAGNGFVGKWKTGGMEKSIRAGMGADVAAPWLQTKHPLDRTQTGFKDGGGIIVAGGTWSPSRAAATPGASAFERNVSLNFGNRIDCFAQADDVTTLSTGAVIVSTLTSVGAAGTSVATPMVTGCVALIQGFMKARYQAPLKPALVRAILSDPSLNTPAQPTGAQIGVMPDLARIFALLTTPAFDRKALATKLKTQQTSTTPAPPASGWAPYRSFDEAAKQWVDLTIDPSTADQLFATAATSSEAK